MNNSSSDPSVLTGFAVFDQQNRLMEANATILGVPDAQSLPAAGTDRTDFFQTAFANITKFDGEQVKASKSFVGKSIERWENAEAGPIEAQTVDGRWKLLTTHPRPGGGTAFISTDITRLKEVELAHREKSEIFKTVTDSHPLPVFVIDYDTGEILYESLDASKLVGREWDPETPQFISDHYVDQSEMNALRQRLTVDEIIRDHEVQFQRADGSRLWISVNCRLGNYGGRPAITLGILDITERKEQEDPVRGSGAPPSNAGVDERCDQRQGHIRQ